MKTGSILTFGGSVALSIGVLLGLLFARPLLTGDGSRFSNLLALVVLGVVPAAAGFLLIGEGRKQSRAQAERDERDFSELAVSLARQNGGTVALGPLCKASGLLADEAQRRMRKLTGRGLFDLDFDPAGQVVFKLSPEAGAGQLARWSERT